MIKTIALIVFTLNLAWIVTAEGTIDSKACVDCHDGNNKSIPAVGQMEVEASIHEGMECLDCHLDIEQIPHKDPLKPVDCGECHEDEKETYRKHGVSETNMGNGIPTCADCHGSHSILPPSDPKSPKNSSGFPTKK